MDTGIHAREWVSPATGVWTANKVEKDGSRVISGSSSEIMSPCEEAPAPPSSSVTTPAVVAAS